MGCPICAFWCLLYDKTLMRDCCHHYCHWNKPKNKFVLILLHILFFCMEMEESNCVSVKDWKKNNRCLGFPQGFSGEGQQHCEEGFICLFSSARFHRSSTFPPSPDEQIAKWHLKKEILIEMQWKPKAPSTFFGWGIFCYLRAFSELKDGYVIVQE